MPKTYTAHKLTDPMLQRLSKIKNGRRAGGMSVVALINRGLVSEFTKPYERRPGVFDERFSHHGLTVAGADALVQARREGW